MKNMWISPGGSTAGPEHAVNTEERMQAIILAAGMGKRLGELTRHNTKCMIRVGGVTLIERMLRQLDRKNLSRIVIVEGYEGQKLMDHVRSLGIRTPVEFIHNAVYDSTNNIYSLSLAKNYLVEEDTMLLESDVIFEERVLDMLLGDPRDTLALVDRYEPWMDGTCLKLDEDDGIVEFTSVRDLDYGRTDGYYKTVNIYKFSRQFSAALYVPFLEAYLTALGKNEYYEQVLRVIASQDQTVIRAKRLSGQLWYEIDDLQDLDIAQSLFTSSKEEQVRLMENRYGGYWRYPYLLDFCYLVNPCFPPRKMKDEMKAVSDQLLTSYPSGMRVNRLLAAKNFGVPEENIVIGNGASELIRSLMTYLPGKTGFIRPGFEEYPNRCTTPEPVFFIPGNPDFSYTADDLMAFFEEKGIRSLVLTNPDNPSGNYLTKTEVIRLSQWCGERGISLVVDESFADFADEEDASLIDARILQDHPQLYVVKSLSKSWGIPGIRLGILASADSRMTDLVRKDVPIWNINSYAEFFLQIFGRYRGAYEESLKKVRAERTRFSAALAGIPGVRVIPSQADFIMIETKKSAETITGALLCDHGIFIKDLTDKTWGRNYLRLAIRNTRENEILITALREEMESDESLTGASGKETGKDERLIAPPRKEAEEK